MKGLCQVKQILNSMVVKSFPSTDITLLFGGLFLKPESTGYLRVSHKLSGSRRLEPDEMDGRLSFSW
jgi:hypothetical protein